MRISSVQMFQQGLSAMLTQQSKLNQTEQQLASGRKVLTPSDDPVAAVQILDITEDLELIDQYQRNGNVAEGRLAFEETLLGDVGNVLNRVRELVLQANNASQSPETRASIATEVSARISELEALANTRDASGEYVFAGFQSQEQPFVRQGTSYTYTGDDGQRMLQLGSSTQVAVSDSGADIFMSIPSGNGTFRVDANSANQGTAVLDGSAVNGNFLSDDYSINFIQAVPGDPLSYEVLDSSATVVASGNYTSGESIDFAGASVRLEGAPVDGDSFQVAPAMKQDMFAILQNIADELNGSGSTPGEIAQLNNAMGQALNDLDFAMDNVQRIRADVGVRLNHVESQLNINESFNVQLQTTLSEVQDLDYAEAISRFNLQLTALQASQQAFVKMQGLSLFNYL